MEHYIKELNILCNFFYNNDELYIMKSHNIDSSRFKTYFELNNKTKLIFNSYESETLFIYIININTKYIFKKYKLTQKELLHKIFVRQKIYYLNKCHKYFIQENNKMHLPFCKCLIKVKSISNLKISYLINIIKNHDSPYNNNNNNKNSQFLLAVRKLNFINNSNLNINHFNTNTQNNFQYDTEINHDNITFADNINNYTESDIFIQNSKQTSNIIHTNENSNKQSNIIHSNENKKSDKIPIESNVIIDYDIKNNCSTNNKNSKDIPNELNANDSFKVNEKSLKINNSENMNSSSKSLKINNSENMNSSSKSKTIDLIKTKTETSIQQSINSNNSSHTKAETELDKSIQIEPEKLIKNSIINNLNINTNINTNTNIAELMKQKENDIKKRKMLLLIKLKQNEKTKTESEQLIISYETSKIEKNKNIDSVLNEFKKIYNIIKKQKIITVELIKDILNNKLLIIQLNNDVIINMFNNLNELLVIASMEYNEKKINEILSMIKDITKNIKNEKII